MFIPMEGRFEVRALIFSFRELRKVKVSQKPNILRDWNTLVYKKNKLKRRKGKRF